MKNFLVRRFASSKGVVFMLPYMWGVSSPNEETVIEATIKQIQITDARGKVMMTATKSRNINVSSLPSGYYFIKLHTDRGIVSKGLMIAR